MPVEPVDGQLWVDADRKVVAGEALACPERPDRRPPKVRQRTMGRCRVFARCVDTAMSWMLQPDTVTKPGTRSGPLRRCHTGDHGHPRRRRRGSGRAARGPRSDPAGHWRGRLLARAHRFRMGESGPGVATQYGIPASARTTRLRRLGIVTRGRQVWHTRSSSSARFMTGRSSPSASIRCARLMARTRTRRRYATRTRSR